MKDKEEISVKDLTLPPTICHQAIEKVNELLRLRKIRRKSISELHLDPVERCHKRWTDLFWGTWTAIQKYYPNLSRGLLLRLKELGLTDEDCCYFDNDLFQLNPSDEILEKMEDFRYTKKNLNLKTRKDPFQKYDPYCALHDYSMTFFELQKYPPRGHYNQHARMEFIKKHLPSILEKMLFVDPLRKPISDEILKE